MNEWDQFPLVDAPTDAATSPIGRITSYGYASDPNGDSASLGTGRFAYPTGAWDNQLRSSSMAASRDVERYMRAQGIQPMQPVNVVYDDGSTDQRTWDDRTARAYRGQPLTGRVDVYSPSGPSPMNDRHVVRIERAQPVSAPANDFSAFPLVDRTAAAPQPAAAQSQPQAQDWSQFPVVGKQTDLSSAQRIPEQPTAEAAAVPGLSDQQQRNLTSLGRTYNDTYDLSHPQMPPSAPTAGGLDKFKVKEVPTSSGLANPPTLRPANEHPNDQNELPATAYIERALNRNIGGTIAGMSTLPMAAAWAGPSYGTSLLIPIVSGMAGSQMQERMQRYFETPEETGSRLQEAARDTQDHPIPTAIGNLAPMAMAFRPSPKMLYSAGVGGSKALAKALGYLGPRAELTAEQAAALTQTAASAALGAGQHIAGEALQGHAPTLDDTLQSAAMMGVFNQTTGMGKYLGMPYHEAGPQPSTQPRPGFQFKPDQPATSPEEWLLSGEQQYRGALDKEDAFANVGQKAEPTAVSAPTDRAYFDSQGNLVLLPENHPNAAAPVRPPLQKPVENAGQPETSNQNAGGRAGEPPAEPAPSEPKKFRAAAFKAPDGTIYEGSWHGAALEKVPEELRDKLVNGFTTVDGEFVPSKEATEDLSGTDRMDDTYRQSLEPAEGESSLSEQLKVSTPTEKSAYLDRIRLAAQQAEDARDAQVKAPGAAEPPPPPKEAPPEATASPIENVASIKNKQTEIDTMAAALRPPEEFEKGSFSKYKEEARAKEAAKPGTGARLASKLIERPREISAVESFQLAIEHSARREKLRAINKVINDAIKSGDTEEIPTLQKERDVLQEQFSETRDVARRAGNLSGKALQARQAFPEDAWDLPEMIDNTQAAVGRKLTEPERAEIERIRARIDEAQKGIEEAESTPPQKPAPTKGLSLYLKEKLSGIEQAARDRIAKRRSEGVSLSTGGLQGLPNAADYVIVGAAKIAKGVVNGAKWASEMLKEFGPEIKPFLKDLFDASKQKLEDEKKQAAWEIRTAKNAEKYRAAAATGTPLQRRAPFVPEASPAAIKARAEMRAAKAEYNEMVGRLKQQGQSAPRQVLNVFKNALHFITAVKILGHGTVGMITHAGGLIWRPTEAAAYWRNFGRQFSMWVRPELHQMLMDNLVRHPRFDEWKRAGLAIDPDRIDTDYSLYAKWMGKLGKAGQRGFDALKLARLELAEGEWNKLSPEIKNGPDAPEVMKAIADIQNKATGALKGRGDLAMTIGTKLAHWLMFAPRLYASRWARVVVDPMKTAMTFAEMADDKIHGTRKVPAADRIAAISRTKHAAEFTVAIIGGLLLNQAILAVTGSKQQVNFTDPTKSDWLKFKAGGKEIVLDGGLLDPVRLIGQIVYGDMIKDRDAKARYRDGTRFEAASGHLSKYLRGKINPTLGLVVDASTGSDFQGRPLPWSSEKPKYKEQTKYSVAEWLASQGPIPVSQGSRVAYDEMRKRGLNHLQAMDILKGAATAVAGMTGAHISPDYGEEHTQKQKPAPKNQLVH